MIGYNNKKQFALKIFKPPTCELLCLYLIIWR
nr:MAG TPA: hypothetical protein [Caudoviricetes sp.]